jgi:hypothetical protein
MMRYVVPAMLAFAFCNIAQAQAPKNTLERQIADALRDVHDRGADLYNGGDEAAGYRIYQGGLVVARGLLGHRVDLQKLISDGMAAAERETSTGRKAFVLHELIEKVRGDLRVQKAGESLTVPPRELKSEKKPDVKPAAGVGEVKDGVIGRVLWKGMPVAGVDVVFVSLGRTPPRVYETTTGAQGVYSANDVPTGRYVILISPGPMAANTKLPERYALATTSPLVIEVKGGGEKVDFVLQ